MLARPSFEPLNERVSLREMVRNNKERLRRAQVGKQVARNEGGKLRAGLPNKPESEIKVAHRGARRDNSIGCHKHAGLIDADIWIALPE